MSRVSPVCLFLFWSFVFTLSPPSHIGDASDEAKLTELLKGSDTVMSFLGGMALMFQGVEEIVVKAAKVLCLSLLFTPPPTSHPPPPPLAFPSLSSQAAGVRRFFPSEYGDGSYDINDPFFGGKMKVRQLAIDAGLEYTSIVSGGFFDFLFGMGSGINAHGHQATLVGDGNGSVYGVDLPDLAKYAVAILRDPESANKTINAFSTSFTYNELVKIFEELSGSKFNVTFETVETAKEIAKSNPDFLVRLIYHIKVMFNTAAEVRQSDVAKYNIKQISVREKAKQILAAPPVQFDVKAASEKYAAALATSGSQ